MWAENKDEKIRQIARQKATRIQETLEYSVFTKTEIAEALKKRMNRQPVKKQEKIAENSEKLTRRQFLKTIGITGTGAMAATVLSPSVFRELQKDPYNGRTRTTPTGMFTANDGDNITNKVTNAASGGGTAQIPAGTFRMDPGRITGNGWKVEGAGIDKTRIIIPSSVGGPYLRFRGTNWSFGNLTFDVEADNSGGWKGNAYPRFLLSGGGWNFHDVQFKGIMGHPLADTHNFSIKNIPNGSQSTIKNLFIPDGQAPPGQGTSNHVMLASMGWNVDGKLVLNNYQAINTHLVAYLWGGGGYHTSNPTEIHNCYFKDVNVGLRPHGNTVVTNTVFDQRGESPVTEVGDPGGPGNQAMRGLWAASNGVKPGRITVKNCDLVCPKAPAIKESSADGWLIEDCCIVGECDTQGTGGGGLIRNSCVDGEIKGLETENVKNSGCNCRTNPPEPTSDTDYDTYPDTGSGADPSSGGSGSKGVESDDYC